ncbi:unnamed protein product [Rotaria socialis]|uniref:Uncharacterized protein n=1 Tax=Rotaria socialis TaxID=392032 RepID=A0A817LQF0_9BILA|nr:unnamed protein product [Rotaria socialis]CAF3434603.1 unnamed protein product [Rotaria socialis]CAF3439996.1 unnamed protein product [Rotaria socialis]CAF3502655.1 unnamed protein product [Rotaria socialis]CAF3638478.1 unnamed protein product [Rotaria socialis]
MSNDKLLIVVLNHITLNILNHAYKYTMKNTSLIKSHYSGDMESASHNQEELIMDSDKHDAGYRLNQEQFDAAKDDNKAVQILFEIYNNISQYSISSSDSNNENK